MEGGRKELKQRRERRKEGGREKESIRGREVHTCT